MIDRLKPSISFFRFDLSASVVVFLVALPLCLGIAQAVGVSPLSGLLTGVIGGVVVASLSASSLSVSGPAAGLIAIIVSAMTSFGSYSAVLSAIVIAGVLQCIFGVMRIGKLAPLIPNSVIQGMLAAIGIMLILQQLPAAFGYVPDLPISLDNTLHLLKDVTPGSVVIMLGGLFVMAIWQTNIIKKSSFLGKIPSPLLAVVWGIIYACLSTKFGENLQIPDTQRVQMPLPTLDIKSALDAPDWSFLTQPSLYSTAFAIALVASIESLLSLEATSKIDPQRRIPSPNKELLAQGMGNIISGILGGLPITSVIVRSSANVYAGARTRVSAILHGLLLFVSAVFFSSFINLIPLASLAAILLYTGFKLASPRVFLNQWKQGKHGFVVFCITLAGILLLGMLKGISLGVVTQLLLSAYQAGRNTVSLSNFEDHYLLRIHQNITFMSKPALRQYLSLVPDKAKLTLESDSEINYWDIDILEILKEFHQMSTKRAILVQYPQKLIQRINQLPDTINH